jgi:tetratricopeptide (TPR) repeat protein
MSPTPKKDKDLESLETSLAAIESENTGARLLKKYGVHPSWIYYYIAFLGLFLVSMVLLIINFSVRPEEPMFLSLQENIIHQEAPPIIEPVKVEEPAAEVVANSKETPKQETKTAKPLEYHFYTPEELQRIANQVTAETAEEYNLIKAEVFSMLGWFGNSQKFKKDGMDFANRVIQANAQEFKNQRALALAHLANGQYERARNILSGLKTTTGDSLKDWMDGYMMIEAGRIQGGMGKLEQVRKNDPSFYPASYILIQQYLKQNQFSKAYEVAQFWKGKSLSHLSFVQLMGEVLDRQQQYVEMVNYLTPFENTYPKDWTILYYLGKGNNKLQKREIAKTYFKKVLGSQENYLVDQIGQANFELGKISLYENNYKDSIVQLVQASQRLPNDSNVRFYLASAYFKNEDYEKSIEIYQQMLIKDQNDPKIRIYLGMAYFELGQYQSAEKNFQLVLNQGSNEPLLFYYLAKVEDQKGNLPKAKEYLQKVLAIEPKHPLAGKMLEKLNSMLAPEPATPATSEQSQPAVPAN